MPVLGLTRTPPVCPAVISVIIPVHNGAEHLRACLTALAASTVACDIIVVDDGSTDSSGSIAAGMGAHVISSSRKGPASARNLGAAAASTDLLLFIDADVCVKPDTVARIVSAFDSDPGLSALFGSYDDEPAKPDFISQYRNLMHHFVHQRAQREAHTFWSGLGAIRRTVFEAHGGFDITYNRPSIEDIELGHRLHQSGCKVILDPSIQAKHLKEWTFFGMLRTDVSDRGVPWTELMLRDSHIPNDLNVSISQRISVALAFLLIGIALAASITDAKVFLAPLLALLFLMLAHYEVEIMTERRQKGVVATALLIGALAAASFWSGQLLIFAVSMLAFILLLLRKHYYVPGGRFRRLTAFSAGCVLILSIIFIALQPGGHFLHLTLMTLGGLLIVINARFYTLLAAKRGRLYALASIPFHVLFFVYSGIAFLIGGARHSLRRSKSD